MKIEKGFKPKRPKKRERSELKNIILQMEIDEDSILLDGDNADNARISFLGSVRRYRPDCQGRSEKQPDGTIRIWITKK